MHADHLSTPSSVSLSPVESAVASVALVVGGTLQPATRHPAIFAADVVGFSDAASELNRAKPAKSVRRLPLGVGHTMATLLAEAKVSPKVKQFLEKHFNVAAVEGMMQSRIVGWLAFQQLRKDPEFARWIRTQIVEPLLTRHNGTLEHIALNLGGSGAGGTYASSGQPLGSATAEQIHEVTDAVVHIHELIVGSFSFLGLGDRIHLNLASKLAESLIWALSPNRNLRQTRGLTLVELPIVASQRDARESYALRLAVAMHSRQLRGLIGATDANFPHDCNLESITIARPSFRNALSHHETAREVGGFCSAAINSLLSVQSRLDVVQNVRVETLRQAETIKSVETLALLVKKSSRVEPSNFKDDCQATPVRFTQCKVWVTLTGSASFSISEHARVVFAAPARTQQNFRDKLSELKAVRAAVSRELDNRHVRLEEARQRDEQFRAAVGDAVRKLYPRNFWGRVARAIANPMALVARLRDTVMRSREAAEELRRLEAEIMGLTEARQYIEAELHTEEQRLQQVLALIQTYCPGTSSHTPSSLIESVDPDLVLPDLLDLAQVGQIDPDEFVSVVASAATRVNLAGLARIAGAERATANDIAVKLINSEPPIRAPYWGGRRPLSDPRRFIVLPPVSRELLSELSIAIRAHAPDVTVVVANSCAGAIDIVDLEVWKPRFIGEIFPAFIAKNLEAAWAERELFFIDEDFHIDQLRELGLQLGPRRHAAPSTAGDVAN